MPTYQEFRDRYLEVEAEHPWMDDPELPGLGLVLFVLPLRRDTTDERAAWRARMIADNYFGSSEPSELERGFVFYDFTEEAQNSVASTAGYSAETVVALDDEVEVDPKDLDWTSVIAEVPLAVDSRPVPFEEAVSQQVELFRKWKTAGCPMIYGHSGEAWRHGP